jgi:decaprenyl-phosphate phosphoribosyltransferase
VSAGRIFEVEILTKTILTIVLFSLASAGIYIYNDFFDKEFDKRHLHKRNRPIAAGEVNETLSLILATVLILLSLIFSYLFIGIQMLILLIIYFVIQFFYFFIGKQIHTLEIFIVASGFVLRAIAGGVSTGIYISPWFNVLVGTTAIFIVAAKRYSEYITSSNFETRVVLKFYSAAKFNVKNFVILLEKYV